MQDPRFEKSDRLARATVFACQQHATAMRDDGCTPYAVHPLRVVETLRRLADERDEAVLCAAVLHDTLEDCALNFDDLAEQFGPHVAGLVAELTNDNRLPKPQRRAQMLDHLSKSSLPARRIKLADRLDNVLDLLRGHGSEEKRSRYVDETQRILQACAGASAPLEEALKLALAELQVHG